MCTSYLYLKTHNLFFCKVIKMFLFLFEKNRTMAGKAKAPKGKTPPKKAAQKTGKGTQPEKPIITCSEPVQQESKFAIDIKTDSTNVPYGKGMYCI